MIELIRQKYGLDQPIHVQYLKWLGNLAKGDLGESFRYRRPVTSLIRERVPYTLQLAVLALLFDALIRDRARHPLGGQTVFPCRQNGDPGFAHHLFDTRILARTDAGAGVLRESRLVSNVSNALARLRVIVVVRQDSRSPLASRTSRLRARGRISGGNCALHAQSPARGTERGIRVRGAGAGAEGANGDPQARAAQRADPDSYHLWTGIALPAGGRRAH